MSDEDIEALHQDIKAQMEAACSRLLPSSAECQEAYIEATIASLRSQPEVVSAERDPANSDTVHVMWCATVPPLKRIEFRPGEQPRSSGVIEMSGSDGHGNYDLMDQLESGIDLLTEIGNGVEADELLAWAEKDGRALLLNVRAEIQDLNRRLGEALSRGWPAT